MRHSVADAQVAETRVAETRVAGTQVAETQVAETRVPDTHLPDTEVPDTRVPDTQVPGVQRFAQVCLCKAGSLSDPAVTAARASGADPGNATAARTARASLEHEGRP